MWRWTDTDGAGLRPISFNSVQPRRLAKDSNIFLAAASWRNWAVLISPSFLQNACNSGLVPSESEPRRRHSRHFRFLFFIMYRFANFPWSIELSGQLQFCSFCRFCKKTSIYQNLYDRVTQTRCSTCCGNCYTRSIV